MNSISFLRTCLFLGIFAVGMTFMNAGTAHAVADVSVAVSDGGSSLGGATISLTGPDGATQTYQDDDDDGLIGCFNAPADGGVSIDYDVSRGSPRVSVNDTGGRSRASSSSPWSVDLLSGMGFGNWRGQFDNGSGSFNDGNKGKMRKYALGLGARYAFPNAPLFLASTFFYHAKGKTKEAFNDGGSFDLDLRERWRMSFMLGWMVAKSDSMTFAIMAGITLARMNMRILNSGSLQAEEKKLMAVPTFGAEAAWRLGNTNNLFFVLGMTASIMNNVTHVITGSNQFVRANGGTQFDVYSGIRIPF
jgi:hypothetical protein